MQITIFTVGHSNLTAVEFLKLIEAHSIKMVYDVRSVPFSRFAQFNKDSLIQNLQESKIAYIYGGEKLGGRINDPTCYTEKVLPERKVNIAELVDYFELIKRDWFQDGINQLIDVSKKYRTTIMCSEENPARCHRNLLVARRLIELGAVVYHIRRDGRLETAIIKKGPESIQEKLF